MNAVDHPSELSPMLLNPRGRPHMHHSPAELEALSGWPGLHTGLAVEAIRGVNGSSKVESEIRYFLSSCRDDPAVLAPAIRSHWPLRMRYSGCSTSPIA